MFPDQYGSPKLMQEIDLTVPNNDSLEKRGKVGKFIARNRRIVVLCLALCVVLTVAIVAIKATIVASHVVETVVEAVVESIHFFAPDHSHETLASAVHNLTMPSGLLLVNVVDPVSQIRSAQSALLLHSELEAGTVAHLTQRDIVSGYWQWHVSNTHTRNFTFARANDLLRNITEQRGAHCDCYPSLAIPLRVVYAHQSDCLMFEPEIVWHDPALTSSIDVTQFPSHIVRSTAQETIALRFSVSADVNGTVVRDKDELRAIQYWATFDQRTHSPIAKSGIVSYLTTSGYKARVRLVGNEFACVQHCMWLIDPGEFVAPPAPLPNVTELEPPTIANRETAAVDTQPVTDDSDNNDSDVAPGAKAFYEVW